MDMPEDKSINHIFTKHNEEMKEKIQNTPEGNDTELPQAERTYYEYFGSILQNGSTYVTDNGSSYEAKLSWYDLIDIDQDNEKELIAEYNVPARWGVI